ncbi:hypothetical protein DACRYDRAFT_19192 [Dacryopinax primogenitus]|uniref:Uncharacterized protein n=1 Tax=Dacryopinax primogenitus (strain DJM 731) TaxID=1858805 RepID=M5FNW8_DACPD|nr:uncharacterized protein DACRYDRAFT_19192 [Dacryopinax primogenitus]EJT96608.1 hypothetical protein DACRYDRAFT_19192 [Dacryopinax primogenitus]
MTGPDNQATSVATHLADLVDGLTDPETHATLLKTWGTVKARVLDEELMANPLFAARAREMEMKARQALNDFSGASADDQQLDKMSSLSLMTKPDESEDTEGTMDEGMTLRSRTPVLVEPYPSPRKGGPEKKATSRRCRTMGDEPLGAIKGLGGKRLTDEEWDFIHQLHVQGKKENSGRRVNKGFWEDVHQKLSLEKRGITKRDCCNFYFDRFPGRATKSKVIQKVSDIVDGIHHLHNYAKLQKAWNTLQNLLEDQELMGDPKFAARAREMDRRARRGLDNLNRAMDEDEEPARESSYDVTAITEEEDVKRIDEDLTATPGTGAISGEVVLVNPAWHRYEQSEPTFKQPWRTRKQHNAPNPWRKRWAYGMPSSHRDNGWSTRAVSSDWIALSQDNGWGSSFPHEDSCAE